MRSLLAAAAFIALCCVAHTLALLALRKTGAIRGVTKGEALIIAHVPSALSAIWYANAGPTRRPWSHSPEFENDILLFLRAASVAGVSSCVVCADLFSLQTARSLKKHKKTPGLSCARFLSFGAVVFRVSVLYWLALSHNLKPGSSTHDARCGGTPEVDGFSVLTATASATLTAVSRSPVTVGLEVRKMGVQSAAGVVLLCFTYCGALYVHGDGLRSPMCGLGCALEGLYQTTVIGFVLVASLQADIIAETVDANWEKRVSSSEKQHDGALRRISDECDLRGQGALKKFIAYEAAQAEGNAVGQTEESPSTRTLIMIGDPESDEDERSVRFFVSRVAEMPSPARGDRFCCASHGKIILAQRALTAALRASCVAVAPASVSKLVNVPLKTLRQMPAPTGTRPESPSVPDEQYLERMIEEGKTRLPFSEEEANERVVVTMRIFVLLSCFCAIISVRSELTTSQSHIEEAVRWSYPQVTVPTNNSALPLIHDYAYLVVGEMELGADRPRIAATTLRSNYVCDIVLVYGALSRAHEPSPETIGRSVSF